MIRLESLTKRYPGGEVAVDRLDLEVADGEVCMLVGPSGCGKTTTLKMINRLVEPSEGRILIDGDDVTRSDPVLLRRRIGYVIQQVGLFPHLSVGDNIATVPRLVGWDKPRIRARVDELLELVGLDPSVYRSRYPHQLSGGQRQRVGVARALGVDPPVLLMDEPFGAIDPIARDRLQHEFLRLQAEVKKTVVFVTHDVDEAVRLGDRMAVLRQGGVLEQYASPADVLGTPASPFVADFVGADRGLKRLSVVPVAGHPLATLPVVAPGTPAAEAVSVMDAAGAAWAVVVEGPGRRGPTAVAGPSGPTAVAGVPGPDAVAGRPVGAVERSAAVGAGAGTVDAVTRPMPAVVSPHASLKDAFAQLLLTDAGWVAAVDEEGRYRGVVTVEVIEAAARPGSG